MKKYLFGFLTIALAIGSAAFTTKTAPDAKRTPVWFVLKAGGNPDIPADYTSTTTTPSTLCTATASVCAILAEDNTAIPGLQPRFDAVLDAYLIAEIDESQNGLSPDANVVKERN